MAPAAKPAGRIALWGMMAAVTVTLSLLEGLLPPLPALPPGARVGLAGVSVAGAVCHDLGQLLCGRLIMGTPALWAYAPVMLLLALPAGVLTGTLLRLLLPAVRRFWPDLSSRKTHWKG